MAVIFFTGCAKKGLHEARTTRCDVGEVFTEALSFKGLAYVVAERADVKWANNVSILVKQPGGIRLDALEKITDVVATIASKGDGGFLHMPLEDKWYPLKKDELRLPKIGDIPMSARVFGDILVGRPKLDGGRATVSESFHTDKGSYFVHGQVDEMEMSAKEGVPLAYTRYVDEGKKGVVFEAAFDEFFAVGGKKFPRHIIIRFEHPKLVMDIRYKEIRTEVNIPWELLEIGPSKR